MAPSYEQEVSKLFQMHLFSMGVGLSTSCEYLGGVATLGCTFFLLGRPCCEREVIGISMRVGVPSMSISQGDLGRPRSMMQWSPC